MFLGFQRGHQHRGVEVLGQVAGGDADVPATGPPLRQFVIGQGAGGHGVDRLTPGLALIGPQFEDQGLAGPGGGLDDDILAFPQGGDGGLLPQVGHGDSAEDGLGLGVELIREGLHGRKVDRNPKEAQWKWAYRRKQERNVGSSEVFRLPSPCFRFATSVTDLARQSSDRLFQPPIMIALPSPAFAFLSFPPRPDCSCLPDGLVLRDVCFSSLFSAANFADAAREVPVTFRKFQSILGDPTLRLFRVAPPGLLNVSRVGATATLSWTPSSDPGCVYFVYQSANGLDGFSTLLNSNNPVQGLTVTDTGSAAGDLYQVRACRLQITGAGSFWNTSQGTFGVTP